jgi:hypothetical protein
MESRREHTKGWIAVVAAAQRLWEALAPNRIRALRIAASARTWLRSSSQRDVCIMTAPIVPQNRRALRRAAEPAGNIRVDTVTVASIKRQDSASSLSSQSENHGFTVAGGFPPRGDARHTGDDSLAAYLLVILNCNNVVASPWEEKRCVQS